jgi:TPR repeat protein
MRRQRCEIDSHAIGALTGIDLTSVVFRICELVETYGLSLDRKDPISEDKFNQLKRDAARGDAYSLMALASKLSDKDDKYLNYAEAEKVWLRASKKDPSGEALFNLALLCDARKASDDLLKSTKCYCEAAMKGHDFAQLIVAGHYEPVDMKVALMFYERAAKNGSLLAMERLGKLLVQEGSIKEGKEWLRKAAGLGVKSAAQELRRMRRV